MVRLRTALAGPVGGGPRIAENGAAGRIVIIPGRRARP
jgi:hypothetical protein